MSIEGRCWGGQLKALDVCLGGSSVLTPDFWYHPSQVMGGASFPNCRGGGGGVHYEWQSHVPQDSTPGLVKNRASEELCWLSTALGLQQAQFAWAPVVTHAMDINTDLNYSRTMDPDMEKAIFL